MNQRLSHLNSRGEAHMVDVGDKAITRREAVASGCVRMASHTLTLLSDGKLPKGDVLATARIAAIQAAKKTAELIPLCHTLPLSSVKIEFYIDPALPGVRIEARCRIEGRTGVEMEALTAVSIAGLTLYDMCKAVDKGMVIEAIQLESKQGGKSGDWVRVKENSSAGMHSGAQYQDMANSTDESIVPAEERVSVNVLFFASLREQLGIERISIAMSELEQPTIAALKRALAIKDERFLKLQQERILCAVNQRMCRDDTVLAATDEVGFFPPVTGG